MQQPVLAMLGTDLLQACKHMGSIPAYRCSYMTCDGRSAKRLVPQWLRGERLGAPPLELGI